MSDSLHRSDSAHRPVVVAAFANDRADDTRYLRNLPEESRRLRDVLEGARELCELVLLQNVTLKELIDTFQKYRNRIAIFHYGGHASSFQMLLESESGAAHAVQGAGLAMILGRQRGLQLVFLNGCSTERQTEDLLAARVPCVIATTQNIDDKIATNLAVRFYKGLSSGATIRCAFEECIGEALASTGGQDHRLLERLDEPDSGVTDAGRFPWFLQIAPGAEMAGDWNFPVAVNNPLFGLPALPPQDLPESPYRSLHWFRREDAEIFFGRGREIRDLFTLVTATGSPPIVLLYGQSGVGKSSLLDAGLLPRLETVANAAYVRRNSETGLSATLLSALGAPSAMVSPRKAWQQLEMEQQRPLVILVDQVEEVFTRPQSGGREELSEFIQLLTQIFATASDRPQGRLILGFRKEWFAEIDQRLSEARLPRAKVFLERLSRQGVIEIVNGPASQPRLSQVYSLSIEAGLPELIADDLLVEPATPVAPTLQILLTRMWEEARRMQPDRIRFDSDFYQALRRQGILLDDFLRQQLQSIGETLPSALQSGFVLDFLAGHTTPLGTAAQQPFSALTNTYQCQAQSGLLNSTLRLCQDAYLLSVHSNAALSAELCTVLAHDTLAPLVRALNDQSDLPGQRARRILDSRILEWRNGQVGTPLDASDLSAVEAGRDGTRTWDADEQRLLEESRQLHARNLRQRMWLQRLGIAAVMSICILAAVAFREWSLASQSETKALASAETALAAEHAAEVQTVIAQRQLASGHVTQALVAWYVADNLFSAALNFAAAAEAVDNPVYRESLCYAAAQTLQGIQLHRHWDCGVQVRQAWPLRGQKALLWFGRPGFESTISLAADDEAEPAVLCRLIAGEEVTLRHDEAAIITVAWNEQNGAKQYAIVNLPSDNQPVVPPLILKDEHGEGAFSRNGFWMVTWDETGVRLRETRSPDVLHHFPETGVARASVSSDGRLVLLQTRDADSSGVRLAGLWRKDAEGKWNLVERNLPVSVSTNAEFLENDDLLIFDERGQGTIFDSAGRRMVQLAPGLEAAQLNWEWASSADGQTIVARTSRNEFSPVFVWQRDHTRSRTLDPIIPVTLEQLQNTKGLILSRDGRRIAAASDDGLVIGSQDQSDEFQYMTISQVRKNGIHGGEFSADGRKLLIWSADDVNRPDIAFVRKMGQAEIYDIQTGRRLAPPLMHSLRLRGVVFTDQDQRVMTWSEDGVTRIWNLPSPKNAPQPPQFNNPVLIDVSPDGRRLLCQEPDRLQTIRVFELPEFRELPSIETTSAVVTATFGNTADHVFVGTRDDRDTVAIDAWTWSTQTWQRDVQLPIADHVSHTRQLADRRTSLYGAVSSEQTQFIKAVDPGANSIRCDSRSRKFLSWSETTVCVWDAALKPLAAPGGTVPGIETDAPVRDAFLDLTGQRVILRTQDGFEVWDLSAGKPVIRRLGQRSIVGLELSADGKTLLEWGGSSGQLKVDVGGYACLWDVDTWQRKTPLLKHDLGVRWAKLSLDGTRMLTTTELPTSVGMPTVHLWDLNILLEPTAPFPCPRSSEAYAAFVDGDRSILVWGGSGLHLWNLHEYPPLSDKPRLDVERQTGTTLGEYGTLNYKRTP